MYHKDQSRILGIDLLKLLILLAISILHANEFIFFTDEFPFGMKSPVFYMFSFYARTFAIGGQALVAIIFFLFGFKGKDKLYFLRMSLFCLFGQGVLFFGFNLLEWDIYTFLFFTLLIFYLAKSIHQIKNGSWIIISLIFLLIPNMLYINLIPSSNPLSLLVGTSILSPSGPWPLFPWFFLCLLFYQIGIRVKANPGLYSNWSKTDSILWPILFMISIPHLGHYFFLPVGKHYYHFAFYQHSIKFFANFIPYVFFIRISLLNKTQSILSRFKISSFMTKSYWNRYLALTYIISIIYIYLGMKFREAFYLKPWIFDFYGLSIMPVSELASRFLIGIRKKIHSLLSP